MKPIKVVVAIFFVTTILGTPSYIVKADYVKPSEVILFNDGYENNTARVIGWTDWTPLGWTFNDVSSFAYEEGQPYAYAELVRNSTEAHQGNFSSKHFAPHALRMVAESGKVWWRSTYCNFMKRFYEEQSELYVRWYQKFETLPTGNWEDFIVFYMLGPRYFTRMEVHIAMMDDQIQLSYGKLWFIEDGEILYTGLGVPVNITTGQWYRFEVYYKSDPVNGEYRAWFEGDEILSVTNLNTTPGEGQYLPNGFDLGILNRRKNDNYTAWTDDVLVATRRVLEVDPIVDLALWVLDNKTGIPVSNALVQLEPHQGYTNDTGAITYEGLRGFTSYEGKISKSGYRNQVGNVDVFDEDTVLKFYLEPFPEGKGALKARAWKGNESVQAIVTIPLNTWPEYYVTPFLIDMDAGTYNLTAFFDDQNVTQVVTVVEGEYVDVDFKFTIQNGTLEIHAFRESSEVEATAIVSNHFNITKIFVTPASIELKPGTYILEITYGDRTLYKNRTIEEGQNLFLTFYFEPEIIWEYDYLRDWGIIILPVAMAAGIVIFIKKR